MSTETDVFAQRTALFTDEDSVLNPVELANKIHLFSKEPFIDLLTYETLPGSFTRAVRKVSNNLNRGDANYHPHGLPHVKVSGLSWDTYPIFWLRNQNIDLDSAWWGIFTEMGWSYNNNPTAFNDEYWRKDLNNLAHIPEDNFTKLSEIPVIQNTIAAWKDPRDAVPIEIKHANWFKAHPEYVKTQAIMSEFGIDVKKDILDNFRQDPSHENFDHIMFGFFTSLVPRTQEEGEYLYRFFREMFKDKAWASPKAILHSPCVVSALKSEGFYNDSGSNLGWINETSSDLSTQKALNYHYQYSAISDGVDVSKLYEYVDPKNEMSLELNCDDVIIRKIAGTKNNKRHGDVDVVLGKGAYFPEFTHFGAAVYPDNPRKTSYSLSNAQLKAYDNNVLNIHEYLMTKEEVTNKDPTAWICIRCYKDFRTHSAQHDWDRETQTTLNENWNGPYIEEIILINPRIEYRGIYGAAHKSPRTYKTLKDNSYTESLDSPYVMKFNQGLSRYVEKKVGSNWTAEQEDTDSLVVPLVPIILNQMILKRRELVIAFSMSVLSLAIVRTKTSWMDDLLKIAMIIAIVILVVVPGGQALLGELATISTLTELAVWVAVKYITFQGIELITEEIAEFLVDELGFEVAAQFLTIVVAVVTFKATTGDPSALTDQFLSLATNFSDEYVSLTQAEVQSGLEDLQAFGERTEGKLEELQEISDNLLGDVSPEVTLATKIYLLNSETPSEFFNRTIEDKNPGIKTLEMIESEITRFKLLDHTKPPIIAGDEPDDDEFLDQMV